MIALIRTELLKLLWTRATWGFLAAAVAIAVVRVEMVLSNVGKADAPPTGSRQLTLDVLGAGGFGTLITMLLGVVLVTREFHHATWTSTLPTAAGGPYTATATATSGHVFADGTAYTSESLSTDPA